VLKLIVEHPALGPYLHPSVSAACPGGLRSPAGAGYHTIEVRSALANRSRPRRGTQPHLRILSFTVDGSRAKAVAEYKVEGVQAVFDLRRDSKGWWTVTEAKVVEHGRRSKK